MTYRSGIRAARGQQKTRLSVYLRRALEERSVITAPSPATRQSTTIRPVPKPRPQRRHRATVEISRLAAHRLAAAQGSAFTDIAADVDAAETLTVAAMVDRRRDPLVAEMLRLFVAIRHDLNTSTASRALATLGEACGREAIRLDQIKDEHDVNVAQFVAASIEAGREVVAVQESLLTGQEATT